MFGSLRVLRKEKKYWEKLFSHVWFLNGKYEIKSNTIKIH